MHGYVHIAHIHDPDDNMTSQDGHKFWSPSVSFTYKGKKPFIVIENKVSQNLILICFIPFFIFWVF